MFNRNPTTNNGRSNQGMGIIATTTAGAGIGMVGKKIIQNPIAALKTVASGVGLAAMGFDVINSIAKARKAPQVLHSAFGGKVGRAGQNYSLGDIPTTGIRFAGRYRRHF